MNKDYISEADFAALSDQEQVQALKQMLADIPHEDLVMLKDVLPKISKIQETINNIK